MPVPWGRCLLLLAAAAYLGIPPAGASGPVVLEIVGSARCLEGRTYCFDVTNGSLDALVPGTNATVTFVNEGRTLHDVHLGALGARDPRHRDTPSSAAFARSDTIDHGRRATFAFSVPPAAGAGVYAWCDVAGHEALGMWLGGPPGGGRRSLLPAPGSLAVAALLGGLAVSRRRVDADHDA